MATHLRIAVISPSRSSEELKSAFPADLAWLEIFSLDISPDVLIGHRPDIVIIELDESGRAEEMAQRLAALRDWQQFQIIALARGEQAQRHDLPDGFDEMIMEPLSRSALATRLKILQRLDTMENELRLRAQTAALFGDDLPSLPERGDNDEDDADILLLGTNRAEIGTVAAALGPQTSLSVCTTAYETLERLEQWDHDALVIVAQPGDESFFDLLRDIRNNPRLYTLPVLYIAAPGEMPDIDRSFEAGASDVLTQPWTEMALRLHLKTLVRQQRYRRAMYRVYQEARKLIGTDNLTGLYSHGFFHAHLERVLRSARQNGKPLSIGILNVKAMRDINRNCGYVAGDQLLAQIGSVIGMLVRGEDLPARIGGQEFALIMPNTPDEVARVAIARIAGVVDYTSFSVRGLATPLRATLRYAAAAVGEEEDFEALIERVRADLT